MDDDTTAAHDTTGTRDAATTGATADFGATTGPWPADGQCTTRSGYQTVDGI